ncbi:MAG: hypothetical protein GXP31_05035 [Kiritimatiellaeota bacterium]|nr:hypothetical protein [Kiritimatiellota bacterium]
MTQKAEAVSAVKKRTREVARASLGAAMPARSRLVQTVRVGARRRIPLAATGRDRLRQAILMREVLARPRAFDL